MDDEWIPAAEALASVEKSIPFRAAQAICSRANDGLVTARAQTLIFGERRANDVEIPAGFWWARGEAALTQKWASGDFETWLDKKIHCRAYGVTFLERDIAAMLPRGRATMTKPGRATPGNYASSSRCVTELQTRLACTKQEACDHIVRFCRAGLIESRCTSFWCEVTKLIDLEEQELENVAIPTWFWDHCTSGPDAILDWRTGNFAGHGLVVGQRRKVRIRGAEFDISGIVDFELMLREQDSGDDLPDPAAVASVLKQPALSARGGRSRSESWTDWIAELVCHIHEEGMPPGSGAEGQDALIGAIDERLAARGIESLGRSTVQAATRAVLVRLRSAGN